MPDQITQLLDDIDRLDKSVHPGPWRRQHVMGGDFLVHGDEDIAEAWGEGNAEFISLSRTALPALAQAVRAVLKECESFEIAHDDPENTFHEGVQWTVKAIRQTITGTLKGAD